MSVALDEPAPLYFLHIPKTAGTSLDAWFATKFAPAEKFPYFDAAQIASLRPNDVRGYGYYAGHFGFPFTAALDPRCRVLTWLREPARRLFSSYRYLRALDNETSALVREETARAQLSAAKVMTFEEWLRLPQDRYCIHNFIVHSLAGESDSREALPRARRNLEGLDHFGLVERMQASIDLLCHRLGWWPEDFAIELNTTSQSPNSPISTDALSIIHERSAKDISLYEHASALLEHRIKDMQNTVGLCEDADRPSQQEKLRQWLRAHYAKFEAPRVGVFSPRWPRTGAGWWPPMREEVNLGPFTRWSGPETASEFYLNVPRDRPLDVSISILSVMDVEILDSLRLEVNGASIQIRGEPAPRASHRYAHRFVGCIGLKTLQAEPGLARCVFRVSKTFAEPVVYPPNLEPKLLGFELESIEVVAR